MINADIILQIVPCVLAAAVWLSLSSAVVADIIDHGLAPAIVLRVFDFTMQRANQALQVLERQGLLRLDYGGIRILALEWLRRYEQ